MESLFIADTIFSPDDIRHKEILLYWKYLKQSLLKAF